MLLTKFNEFGGLEDIVASLAVWLKQEGHEVSVVSPLWVPSSNQYCRLLTQNGVALVQLPRWLSKVATDWPTKEQVAARIVKLCYPLVVVAAMMIMLVRRQSWRRSFTSVQGWLRQRLLMRVIGPDRRELVSRLLLDGWCVYWRPEVLHIHGYTDGLMYALDWAYSRNLPTIYEEHTTPDANFDWWKSFQQHINKASIIVAVSEKSMEAFNQICTIERPIMTMTPIVADPFEYGWNEHGPLRDDHVQILTVARLYVAKGLHYLLEAIAQVRRTHPNVQLRVYGNGPLREELMAYAATLGLDGAAIFVGTFAREELPALMAETDIFVLSSILEGLPVTIVEAMAYGRPIIATTVGGIPELIQHEVNGLLCPPGDSIALAEQIIRLLNNSNLRVQLGQNARKAYETGNFHPQQVCQRIMQIYKLAQQRAVRT